MEIDARETVCPVCGYEFPIRSSGMRWAVFILVFILVVYFLYAAFA